MHAFRYIFFHFNDFSFNFSNLKGICTQSYVKKKEATVLIQKLKTIVPLYLAHCSKNSMFLECTNMNLPIYVIIKHSTGCAVQY